MNEDEEIIQSTEITAANNVGPPTMAADSRRRLTFGSPELAVSVEGLYKSYGQGRSQVPVLRDLDMTVPLGAIYGLLGPSGCGKTTLLRCILGRLHVNSGDVKTLDRVPGSIGHEVPGKRVGYMPQELALFSRFTISETLSYFGRLHQMKRAKIRERTSFLIEFLNLPEKFRLIEQLSGGQQRRTSFAIALLQEPELLVLDEPTVGVDPLLRQRIWEHLITIAKSSVTVIITTHYVEEARQANMVGLMRNGRMLAEAPPDTLLLTYQQECLEDVFLHLCQQDSEEVECDQQSNALEVVPRIRKKRRASGASDPEERSCLLEEGPSQYKQDKVSPCQKFCSWWPKCHKVVAQAIKNFIMLRRNIGFLLFEFFLPALQITLFCLCIGREPYNLKMNIVNNETCTNGSFCGSMDFLSKISNHSIKQVGYSRDLQGAISDVRQGHAWGVIEIGESFTVDFVKRYLPSPSNETIEGSTIHLYLDMTNQQISMTIQSKLLLAFESFSRDFIVSMGKNPLLAQIPLKIEEAVYGEMTPSFTNFMAPGIILSIIFFMATGLTALAFVLERKQGLMDRSMVAGVSTIEIMLGHMCTQFVVMTVQVGLLLVFALAIFGVPYEGPLILVILLALFQGVTGMAMGLFVSSLCEEETSAMQCALGLVYPNMLLSGIIWPLESMPFWLQYISYFLPMTFAADSMRSVLARGWDITYLVVWRGYLTTFAWGIIMLLLAAVVVKIKGK